MDSLTSLCSALPKEEESPSQSISSSFSFLRVIKIIRSLAQLRNLDNVLIDFAENLPKWNSERSLCQQTVVTLQQEEVAQQTQLSQAVVESFNSTLSLAETERRISSIREVGIEQSGTSCEVLDIILNSTKQLNETKFSNLRVVIEHFASVLQRKALVAETVKILSSRIANAEERLKEGKLEQVILQERISEAVLDLVLEWKHSQEVVAEEKVSE